MLTKNEAAWLVVRAVGMAFLFSAIWQAIVTGYYAYAICQPAQDSGHMHYILLDEIELRGSASAICMAVSFYFLRHGRFFHSLLVRDNAK